jgi:hypothetical protein
MAILQHDHPAQPVTGLHPVAEVHLLSRFQVSEAVYKQFKSWQIRATSSTTRNHINAPTRIAADTKMLIVNITDVAYKLQDLLRHLCSSNALLLSKQESLQADINSQRAVAEALRSKLGVYEKETEQQQADIGNIMNDLQDEFNNLHMQIAELTNETDNSSCDRNAPTVFDSSEHRFRYVNLPVKQQLFPLSPPRQLVPSLTAAARSPDLRLLEIPGANGLSDTTTARASQSLLQSFELQGGGNHLLPPMPAAVTAPTRKYDDVEDFLADMPTATVENHGVLTLADSKRESTDIPAAADRADTIVTDPASYLVHPPVPLSPARYIASAEIQQQQQRSSTAFSESRFAADHTGTAVPFAVLAPELRTAASTAAAPTSAKGAVGKIVQTNKTNMPTSSSLLALALRKKTSKG